MIDRNGKPPSSRTFCQLALGVLKRDKKLVINEFVIGTFSTYVTCPMKPCNLKKD
uniref:Uncharacterized protein n=1 Tax=Romanomermis culicivorax TaxID=13658 RepID=A0A915I5A7_ROMCU